MMDKNLLTAAGINYADGVRRFAGKEHLYEKYLLKFFSDPTFAQLGERISAGDCGGAFRLAHALKGMAGNLSLDKFYAELCPMVEQLRAGDISGLKEKYAALEDSYILARDSATDNVPILS